MEKKGRERGGKGEEGGERKKDINNFGILFRRRRVRTWGNQQAREHNADQLH
jgi:hypothetical protein